MSNETHPQDFVTKTPDEILDAELSSQLIKRTKKLGDNTVELALQVKEARQFLSWSTNHLKGAWMDWLDQANKALADMTQLRMALNRETVSALSVAKDMVDFYGSERYQAAHKQFKEQVELLERLNALKADGTLSAFADFILKVTCT